jgi:hypothetical protein
MRPVHPDLEAKQMEIEEFFGQLTHDLAKSYETEMRKELS